MKNFPWENGNLSDSSLFKACIREAELISQEKLQEIQGAADELARQAIIDKLKQAEVEHEKIKLKLEQQASGKVEDILFRVELSAAENKDNFTNGIDSLLAKLFRFFNFMDSELEVETDPQVCSMIRKSEETEKEAWIATVIKFLRDKFNNLIKAIFSRDLSFQQKIDKEIKELYERLFSGSLSTEEEIAILELLEVLHDLKLKLQIFAVGLVIKMFAELFSFELTASVKTAKEEGKERSSVKGATKEVRENLEIKVDAKEKTQLKYDVIPGLDAESWLKKPITLTKKEDNLLPKSLKDMFPSVPKLALSSENRKVKETKWGGNQQTKPEGPENKDSKVFRNTAYSGRIGQFFSYENDASGQAVPTALVIDEQNMKSGNNIDTETVKPINIGRTYGKLFAVVSPALSSVNVEFKESYKGQDRL